MYNNLLKRMHFPSLSIYFFPIFSHFFPSPNPNFGVSWEKMGIFSIFKIESFFPLFSYTFFPIFAHPQIQISVCLGQKWGWTAPPPHYCTYIEYINNSYNIQNNIWVYSETFEIIHFCYVYRCIAQRAKTYFNLGIL